MPLNFHDPHGGFYRNDESKRNNKTVFIISWGQEFSFWEQESIIRVVFDYFKDWQNGVVGQPGIDSIGEMPWLLWECAENPFEKYIKLR